MITWFSTNLSFNGSRIIRISLTKVMVYSVAGHLQHYHDKVADILRPCHWSLLHVNHSVETINAKAMECRHMATHMSLNCRCLLLLTSDVAAKCVHSCLIIDNTLVAGSILGLNQTINYYRLFIYQTDKSQVV